MKNAYIIYYAKEAEKNSGFIEMLRDGFKKYEIDLKYISFEKLALMSEVDFEDYFKDTFFVINRTREYKLSRRFEKIHIHVLHSSKITEIGNDKYKTYCYLKDYFNKMKKEPEKEWIADTVLIKSGDLKETIAQYAGKDYVIKSVDGHGGSQVFLLKDTKSGTILNAVKDDIYETLKGHDCVLQKHINSDSNDIRVYILFGKIYAAVLRHGNDGFKSNFSLGGSVEEYFLNDEQKQFVEKFIQAFGKEQLFMAGIDFILTRNGKLIFNELEEMVGSRMLYNCSKHDIVKEYVEQIANSRKEV